MEALFGGLFYGLWIIRATFIIAYKPIVAEDADDFSQILKC